MRVRFLSPKIHSLLDHSLSGGLIMFPFLLNLGGQSQTALWLSVIAGGSVFLLSAPFLFGFPMVASVYYFVIGVAGLLVVALSRPFEEGECLDCIARP